MLERTVPVPKSPETGEEILGLRKLEPEVAALMRIEPHDYPLSSCASSASVPSRRNVYNW
jgi:hypothetical protein